jgi:uncharacterized membrane protein
MSAMNTPQTIDHATLARLVEAGAVRATHVIGQPDGWVLSVQYGTAEQFLAAQRSRKLRLFRKLETLTAYLQEIGIQRFEVDARQYSAAEAQTRHKRPDRAEALKRAHAAAAHDDWFRETIQDRLQAADQPGAVFAPHAAVMADLKAHLDGLAAPDARS